MFLTHENTDRLELDVCVGEQNGPLLRLTATQNLTSSGLSGQSTKQHGNASLIRGVTHHSSHPRQACIQPLHALLMLPGLTVWKQATIKGRIVSGTAHAV